jgi:hypothetical protein
MNPVQMLFDGLARLRSARAFHPSGRMYEGVLAIDGDGPLPSGESPALVRLSRGVGLPTAVPDVLGIAVRVRPLHPAPIDVLCTSTLAGEGPGRWALAPARRWGRATFSSLMPWESGRPRRQVLLRIDDDRLRTSAPDDVGRHLPVEVAVRVIDEHGRAVQDGVLTLTGRSGRATDEVAFDPLIHHPHGWVVGPRWLAHVREAAYVGSRHGRDAHDGTT